jgi:hypothetical protein
VLAPLLLSGCAEDHSHDFDRVDRVAATIAPESCGEIVHREHYGSTGAAEGSPPSLILVVTRDDETYACVAARLEQLGYTDATYGWFKDEPGATVTIAARRLAAGDEFADAAGEDHAVAKAGISLLVRAGSAP